MKKQLIALVSAGLIVSALSGAAFADKIIASPAQVVKTKTYAVSVPTNWKAETRTDGSVIFTVGQQDAGHIETLAYSPDQSDASLLPNEGAYGEPEAVKGLALPAFRVKITYDDKNTSGDLHYVLKDAPHKAAYDLVFRTSLVSEASALNVAKSFSLTPSAAFAVKAGAKTTETRTVEGMKEKFEVVPYAVAPYNVSFKLDASMGVPKVDAAAKSAVFARSLGKSGNLSVTLQIFENRKVNALLNELNKSFASAGFKRSGKVQVGGKGAPVGTQVNFSSKKAYAGYTIYPMKGGYLVIKHSYPLEAGDGAGSMLNALRLSLKLG